MLLRWFFAAFVKSSHKQMPEYFVNGAGRWINSVSGLAPAMFIVMSSLP
jgi:hypothetical protein